MVISAMIVDAKPKDKAMMSLLETAPKAFCQ